MKKIILFASGSGSNVENIINYFKDKPKISVAVVCTNNKNARVLERCERLEVSALYFNRYAFYGSDVVLGILRSLEPDLIVLAGFLWKIPDSLIQAYPNRIINIHPALLPKYGGKGMYGMKVHRTVRESGDPESGITIHYVNENYDEGTIIRQVRSGIEDTDTAETIAEKVHKLEYDHYPKVIEQLLEQT
jgi:phosphoribosylglycinamide formyltransferase-1